MRLPLSLLLALACLLASQPAAHAASEFFVQLGTASSAEDAQAKWEKLKSDYPAQFSSLEFTPRVISSVDGTSREVRIQAGPTRSRNEAQRICSRLNGKSVDCFIVETIITRDEPSYASIASGMPAATASDNTSEPEEEGTPIRLSTEEAAAESSPPSAPPPSQEPATMQEAASATPTPLPWIAQASSEAPAESAGHVEVAEAIRVPVTPEEAPPPPIEETAPAASTPEAPAPRSTPAGFDWVRVTGFASEQAAYDFSQALHIRLSDGGSLRMQVSRPLTGNRAATLNVGPIPDRETAERICAFAAQQDSRLRCGGEVDSAAPAGASSPPPAESYAERSTSQPLPQRSPFAGNPPHRYWVQLGSWRNQAEATRRWSALQEAHGSLLKGYKADYQAPPRISVYAKPTVRLRVGPFISREAASELCGRLSAHSVSCLVVPE